jgi:multimeric flavodoxin WrbA
MTEMAYHSRQYGNTEILAETFTEGAREAGDKVNLINTSERRLKKDIQQRGILGNGEGGRPRNEEKQKG